MIELNEPMDKDKKVYLDVVEKQLNVTQNPIVSKITKHSKPLREIKFRGKRLIDGTWIYGGFMITQKTNKRQIGGTSRYNTIIPETLGQYTGVKDKDGKEIYEGDIIKVRRQYTGSNKVEVVKYAVVWKDCWCSWGLKRIGDNIVESSYLYPINCYYVIGNVSDNPELLKGEEV